MDIDFVFSSELGAKAGAGARGPKPGVIPDIELIATTDVSGMGAQGAEYLAMEDVDGSAASDTTWIATTELAAKSAAGPPLDATIDLTRGGPEFELFAPGEVADSEPADPESAGVAHDDVPEAEHTVHSLAGQHAVLAEMVIAILTALPNRDSVLRLGMHNAMRLRDPPPEGKDGREWLRGVENEIASFSEVGEMLSSKQRI